MFYLVIFQMFSLYLILLFILLLFWNWLVFLCILNVIVLCSLLDNYSIWKLCRYHYTVCPLWVLVFLMLFCDFSFFLFSQGECSFWFSLTPRSCYGVIGSLGGILLLIFCLVCFRRSWKLMLKFFLMANILKMKLPSVNELPLCLAFTGFCSLSHKLLLIF